MGRPKTQSLVCIWNGCRTKARYKSQCVKHYARVLRGAKMNEISTFDKRPAIMINGEVKLLLGVCGKDGLSTIDPEYRWLEKYNWSNDHKGYAKTSIDGKGTFLHHVIMGKPPKGYDIDHIDRNPYNNRRSNLRFVTRQQNVMNSYSTRGRTSIYKGVYSGYGGKYNVSVMCDKVMYSIGTFTDEIDAALAYDCAVMQLHGDKSYFNFIGRTYDKE